MVRCYWKWVEMASTVLGLTAVADAEFSDDK